MSFGKNAQEFSDSFSDEDKAGIEERVQELCSEHDKVPNAETLQTFKETDQGLNLTTYKDADDLFNKLGISSPEGM
ncbi:MAG: hypothetical protein MK076_02110 [Flavobacteriales bacterium]|nr:hypothetical protein [Flavobacteriales bacterium]